jgi:predicted alpha/beta superfamily hydrolase
MNRAALALLLAACSSPGHPADVDGAVEPGSADAAHTAGSDGSVGSDAAVIKVHYPLGTHAITVRGSGGSLSWTTGATTAVSGNTATISLSGLTAAIEYKPLLDDATWARGPNYHVGPGQAVDIYPHFTATHGTVETLIASFASTNTGNARAIYAYLPASYAENTEATYPVVYMHDGQNLWAALPGLAFSSTWNVDTAFDDASETGACSSATETGWGAQPLGGATTTCTGDGDCGANGICATFPEAIVIGVANTDARIYEYTPTTDPTTAGGGGADGYVKLLVDELKPVIDGQLRTRPGVASTVLAGSSLGGLVTAYAGLQHPEVFGALAELSPSTWWNSDWIVGDIATMPASPRSKLIYVDSGAGSADDEVDTDMLAAMYESLGYQDGSTFRHVVQPNAAHSETYWAERFPGAMQLVLGTR